MSDLYQYALEILIVEDDFSFGLELQILLDKLGYKCAGIVDNADSAFDVINKKAPDAILMDIELNGTMSGLDLADKIKGREIPILFISSYKDEATYTRAMSFNAAGYLVKPLDSITLLSAIEACLQALKVKRGNQNASMFKEALLIKKNKVYFKIELKDIFLVTSEREYATIHTISGKFIVRVSLKFLESILPPHTFLKCHKSHIVNVRNIVAIDTLSNVAVLPGELHIPFSRRNKKALLTKFHLLQ